MNARILLTILILFRATGAFAGDGRMQPFAPPPIPHAPHPDAACTDCHGNRRQGGVPAIPHQVRGWCQSCHMQDAPAKGRRGVPFMGEPRGARAYPGAPPTIPHPVFMRENCQACHGRERHPSLRRNPHPGRADCKSCHLL
ncbi:MAG: hypothetical protein P4L36_15235 [Holophaga sp.]|nr:hypothetical protein [Holophaga sp.]